MINTVLFFHSLVLLFHLSASQDQRKYDDTKQGHQRYMVYLIKYIEHSAAESTDWLCGGALVSQSHILTAAACLFDAEQMYAVAEYNKYLNVDQLDEEPCTRERKKPVVKSIIPKTFYTTREGWSNHDIGIAIVETPYDFRDTSQVYCSYPPIPIKVNYDPNLENMNTEVISFGWGHTDRERGPHELIPNSEESLKGEFLRIINTEQCAKKANIVMTEDVIDFTPIICTLPKPENYFVDATRSCDIPSSAVKGVTVDPRCYDMKLLPEEVYDEYSDVTFRRIIGGKGLKSPKNSSKMLNKLKVGSRNHTRRQGTCQNDHGGPLVSWIDGSPIVMGVASTNLYDKSFNCIPPIFFTSTARNEWFIKCSIESNPETLKFCDKIDYKVDSEVKDFIRGNQNIKQNEKLNNNPSNYNLPTMYQGVPSNGNNMPFYQGIPYMSDYKGSPFIYQQIFNGVHQKVNYNSGGMYNNKPSTTQKDEETGTPVIEENEDDKEELKQDVTSATPMVAETECSRKTSTNPGMNVHIVINQHMLRSSRAYRTAVYNVRPQVNLRDIIRDQYNTQAQKVIEINLRNSNKTEDQITAETIISNKTETEHRNETENKIRNDPDTRNETVTEPRNETVTEPRNETVTETRNENVTETRNETDTIEANKANNRTEIENKSYKMWQKLWELAVKPSI